MNRIHLAPDDAQPELILRWYPPSDADRAHQRSNRVRATATLLAGFQGVVLDRSSPDVQRAYLRVADEAYTAAVSIKLAL